MIGIIIPAHNEAEHIGACLRSVLTATRCPELCNEEALVLVVLDACTDGTGDIARAHGAKTLVCEAKNVGQARALGAQAAIEQGVRWLAFTDADSQVAPDWLSKQLALGCDAVCGTVAVHDWVNYSEELRRVYESLYTDADGHRHIHGANLGVSAAAYRVAGGFPPLACSEDVALVQALQRTGASIAWSAAPRVVTSARRDFRANGGFGSTLGQLERRYACSPTLAANLMACSPVEINA